MVNPKELYEQPVYLTPEAFHGSGISVASFLDDLRIYTEWCKHERLVGIMERCGQTALAYPNDITH